MHSFILRCNRGQRLCCEVSSHLLDEKQCCFLFPLRPFIYFLINRRKEEMSVDDRLLEFALRTSVWRTITDSELGLICEPTDIVRSGWSFNNINMYLYKTVEAQSFSRRTAKQTQTNTRTKWACVCFLKPNRKIRKSLLRWLETANCRSLIVKRQFRRFEATIFSDWS